MRGFWIVFSFAPLAAPSDGWFTSDKVQHFFSSAFVQSMSYGALRAANVPHTGALAGASITTAAVGVGKEVYDSRNHGDPSVKDLTWDALGGGAATLLLIHTRR